MVSNQPFMAGRQLIESTRKYLNYLERHFTNIEKAWKLVKENCKDMLIIYDDYLYQGIELEIRNHDLSKFSEFEFTQYRNHFYPVDNTYKKLSKEAWNHHKAFNTHHWQNWTHRVYAYSNDWMIDCTHMIVDWIAMSFEKGDSAKSYYENNKDEILLPEYAIKFIYQIFDRVYPDLK